MSEGAADTSPPYSRAFETLVDGPDDIIGLLAYATYKQSVREAAQNGHMTDKSSRSLPPAMVSALRSSAEQILTQIVSDGIVQATPDIQNTVTIATLNSHHSEVISALQGERDRIEKHITSRTGFLSSFLTNLAAWGVTLLIAVAILYLASRPSVESTLANSIEKRDLQRGAIDSSPVPLPTPTETPHDPRH